MAGRRIRDEADARACLAAAEASGLKRAEWARRERVDARSLNAWRMNLSRKRAPARLVELVPSVGAARYVVRCGHVEVEIGDDFNEVTLFRLLQVVAAC